MSSHLSSQRHHLSKAGDPLTDQLQALSRHNRSYLGAIPKRKLLTFPLFLHFVNCHKSKTRFLDRQIHLHHSLHFDLRKTYPGEPNSHSVFSCISLVLVHGSSKDFLGCLSFFEVLLSLNLSLIITFSVCHWLFLLYLTSFSHVAFTLKFS